MKKNDGSGNWYSRKWGNKRALINKSRRAEKFAQREEKNFRSRTGEEGEDARGEFDGVIAEVQSGYYRVMAEDEVYTADIQRFISKFGVSTQLVIGDRVSFDLKDEAQAVIKTLEPRESKLVRMRADSTRLSEFSKEEHVIAANVDIAVIVAAAAAPPFHPRLIDRYLIMCQYGHVQPVICINKCDLVDRPPDLSIYERMDIPIVFVSVMTGIGLQDIRNLLHGKYSVLTGQSGVGKSSIINYLLGNESLKVGEVGKKEGKGRHTTTTSTLHRLDEESYLIDTPGIRSLGLWKVDRKILRFYFPEFQEYAQFCKYRDCLHVSEPECAVRPEVDNDSIPKERYESYVRMMKE